MSGETIPSEVLHAKSLIKQIIHVKRNIGAEKRIFICQQLPNFLLSTKLLWDASFKWKIELEQLIYILSKSADKSVKRALSDCIAAVGFIMASQYNEFIKVTFIANEKLLSKSGHGHTYSEEERVLILRAVALSIKHIGSKSVENRVNPETVNDLLEFVTNYLNETSSPAIFISLLDICRASALFYPTIFERHFEDVIDFIIGWYVELCQPKKVMKKCYELLVCLKPFLLNTIKHITALMDQFMSDAESYILKLKSESKESEIAIEKIFLLLHALSTMLKIVDALPTPPGLADFMVKIIGRVNQMLKNVYFVEVAEINFVFLSMGRVIWHSLQHFVSSELWLVTVSILHRIIAHPAVDRRTAIKILSLYSKILVKASAELLLEIFPTVLEDKEIYVELTPTSIKELGIIIQFHAALLLPKSLSTLQATYEFLNKRLLASIFMLKHDFGKLNIDSFVHEEKVALVILNSFKNLAVIKNSVIAMGLSPSLFTMLLQRLSVMEKNLIEKNPICHFAIVYLARLHSEKHGNFVTSSLWLMDVSSLPVLKESPTANNLPLLMRFIAEILCVGDYMWGNTRNLVFEWLYGIIFMLSNGSFQKILSHSEVMQVRQALLESFIKQYISSYSGHKSDAVLAHTNSAQTSRVRYFCLLQRLEVFELLKMNSPSVLAKNVHHIFTTARIMGFNKAIGLWQTLPPEVFISNGLSDLACDMSEFPQQTISSCLFTHEHFKIVTDFLLKGIKPVHLKCEDNLWIEDVVDKIHAISNGQSTVLDIASKWRWATAQIAFYCIDNRMKTPLGKALQTYLAFEKGIRQLLSPPRLSVTEVRSQHQADSSFHDKKSDDGAVGAKIDGEGLNSAEQWFRVRALLETLEVMEKLMVYHGYDSIFLLSNISEMSLQFFVKNQSSCCSWLSRMYIPMMMVAFMNGSYAHVIRLGSSALRALEYRGAKGKQNETKIFKETCGSNSQNYSMLVCAAWMARASIELGKWQPIVGLIAWFKNHDEDVEWLKFAALLANGGLEPALDGLLKCVIDFNKTMSEFSLKVIRQFISIILLRLRSPSEMMKVAKVFGSLNNESVFDGAPEGFDEVSWTKLKELTMFQPTSIESFDFASSWDLDSHFVNYELKLIEMTFPSVADRKKDISDLTRRLGDDASMLMIMDTNLLNHTKASVIHTLVRAVKDRKKARAVGVDPDILCSSNQCNMLNRITICYQLSSWIDNRRSNQAIPLKIFSDDALFHLRFARLARKRFNLRSALHQLQMYFSKSRRINFSEAIYSDFFCDSVLEPKNTLAENWYSFLCMKQPSESKVLESYEVAKWLSYHLKQKGCTNHCEPFRVLLDAVVDEFDRILLKNNLIFNGMLVAPPEALLEPLCQQCGETDENLKVMAKLSIKIASMLKSEPSLIKQIHCYFNRPFMQVVMSNEQFFPKGNSIIDSIVPSLLRVSCQFLPDLKKAHLILADWAYKRACVNKVASSKSALLLDCEKKEIEDILNQNRLSCTTEDLENLMCTELDSSKNCLLTSLSELLNLSVADTTLLRSFDVLFNAHCRTKAYLECCIRSYFIYIGISDSVNYAKYASKDVSTILRILELLVSFPCSLADVINAELQRTNDLVWKEVLPQIFARLNHPHASVRDTLCMLLKRVAASAPHAVCYPSIVGITEPTRIITDSDEDINDEHGSYRIDMSLGKATIRTSERHSYMFDCCKRIVIKLEQAYPDLVADVSAFVKEFQRINMLNEERWIFVLSSLDHEVSKRISQIDIEKERTLANPSLDDSEKMEIILEKSAVFTRMVIHLIEDLYVRTCVDIVSVNDKIFRDTYGDQIASALVSYRSNASTLPEAWVPFKQLLFLLSQRSGKKSSVLHWNDLSPHLSSIVHSQIPLPGQESKNFSDLVFIESCCKQIHVLPTKTKPKKISFLGSDGNGYTFLFKGQEDLHLDERVMQLLRICSLIMADKHSEFPSYSSLSYSVTPLGSRSGLIQWVDGAIPLFRVYRKWQQRQLMAESNKKCVEKSFVEVDRPSAIFYRRLKQVFESNNITSESAANRQCWPLHALKDVVEKLIDETPQDLLSREFWLRAGSAETWYHVTERFARSTAVMCMIGSILGLGDRHLDNILVNLDSGQLMHIDYNICFDKGRALRVPETVPFRLTGNIVHALGPTQVEGTFRLSCEYALTKLRANKEVLLRLMDAFIYCPIADWVIPHDNVISNSALGVAIALAVYGSDCGSEKAYEINRTLFSLRVREMSVLWNLNGEQLHKALTRVADILEQYNTDGRSVNERTSSIESADWERVEAGKELKEAISHHHEMMMEIRPIMRSLAFVDFSFCSYMRFYKESFCYPLIRGHKLLDDSSQNLSECIQLFRIVIQNIDKVYRSMVMMSQPNSTLKNLEELCNINDSKVNGKFEQHRNNHAKNTSNRMRRKLEGLEDFHGSDSSGDLKEENLSKPLSITEQVDALIREAMDINNLALMYEGWTAWV